METSQFFDAVAMIGAAAFAFAALGWIADKLESLDPSASDFIEHLRNVFIDARWYASQYRHITVVLVAMMVAIVAFDPVVAIAFCAGAIVTIFAWAIWMLWAFHPIRDNEWEDRQIILRERSARRQARKVMR